MRINVIVTDFLNDAKFQVFVVTQLTMTNCLQVCNENVTTSKFYPVTTLEASPLVSEFDDRFINRNFKFGVIYQEKGQV